MNGKINKNGELCIKRAEKSTKQSCPLCTDNSSCGDWCALFSEPKHYRENDEIIGTTLELCRKELFFEIFVDERKLT